MKLTFLKLLLFISLFSFVDSVVPNFEKLGADKFAELKKVKEVSFKNCCYSNGILNECSKLCTYDFQTSNPIKLLKTLNPGWFLVHYFFPGKCYLSELDHFIPCSIEHQDVTECCKNISKIEKLIETIPQLNKFKEYLPKQSHISRDPEWCQNICAGKSFQITPRSVLSCSSTIKAALACYWHGNVDTVAKNITEISATDMNTLYRNIRYNGIPKTSQEVEKLLQNIDPEAVRTFKENPELLSEKLKKVGATDGDIEKFEKAMNQFIQKRI